MSKTLYLMRHGQTLFNRQNKIQGWCDSPLTELGQKQAAVAGKYFANNDIVFDHAYCSTSERASDTLEIVLQNCGQADLPYARYKGLKEWGFGEHEGKDQCLHPPFPFGDFYKYWGGETQTELLERLNRTLRDIMDRENHDSVLVVSHGGAATCFARDWNHAGKIQFETGFRNCSIFKYEVTEDAFILEEVIQHDFSGIE